LHCPLLTIVRSGLAYYIHHLHNSPRRQGSAHGEKGMKITSAIPASALVILGIVTSGVLLPCTAGAQEFEFGATLNAILSDTVDARKTKPGDTVKAKASEDLKAAGVVVIPRGAKLVGHITEAHVAAKPDDQARLGFVFDRADSKDGRQILLHTTFFALAAPEGAAGDTGSSAAGGLSGGLGGGGTGVGNVAHAAADDTSAFGSGRAKQADLKPSPGAIGGLNSVGTLYASSRGVFGLDDISLEPNTVPSTGSVVILANARSVRLSSGTRMLLSVVSAGKP
jgi:hypothetical protein